MSALDAVVAQIRRGGEIAEFDIDALISPPGPVRTVPIGGTWLSPAEADVQHGQVWTVRTRAGAVIPLAQIDGYDTQRGRQCWRAINLETWRTVQVRQVLEGSCPRLGGRRERAKR